MHHFQLILILFHRIVEGLIRAGMNIMRYYDGIQGEELIFQVNWCSAYKGSAVHKDLTLKNQDIFFLLSNYLPLFLKLFHLIALYCKKNN